MAAGNATIGALKVTLGIDSAQFTEGLKASEERLKKFSGAASVALAGAATAFAAAAAGYAMSIKGVINSADEMSKSAQKFGVPIEQLSKLKYAADLSDVSLETLGTGLRKLAQNMDDVANGSGQKAAEAFAALGIAVTTADGSLRSQNEVFTELAQKLSGMEDGARKTALSMDIFGKSGAELIPMLNAGAEGLQSMADQASQFGLVLDQRTGRAAEAFNDNLTRLQAIQTGFETQLTAELLPAMVKLSDQLVSLASDANNTQSAISFLGDVFERVVRLAAEFTVDVRALGGELRALFNLANSSEGFAQAFATFGTEIAAVKDQATAGRAAIDELFNVGPDDKVDAAFAQMGNGAASIMEPAGNAAAAVQKLREQMGALAAGEVTAPSGGGGKPSGGGGGRSSGGGGGSAIDRLEREREFAERRLEFLRVSLMTEEEEEAFSFQKRLEQLQEFQDAKVLSEQEAAGLRLQIEQDYQNKLAQMHADQLAAYASTIGSVGSIIGDLSTIMGREGDKQLAVTKALSIAQALINTYTGITKALTLPFPASLAAAAQVAAQGFAAVAGIRSTSKGSSGGGRGVSGGGAAAAPAAPAATEGRNLFVSGISPNQLYTGDMLRNLMEALVGAQNDGYKLTIA